MKEKIGEIFSIAIDNLPIPGCTVSKKISDGENSITYFSLAKNTDISAEIYPYHRLILVVCGSIAVYSGKDNIAVNTGECILTPADAAVGIKTDTGCVYVEIIIRSIDKMNKSIEAGKIFKLAELVPYQDDKIVNMDVVHNDKMKFALMAFDEGTGLSEHAAPGEAIVFALDGEGVIRYEGKDYNIKAGENFHFAKGGLHSVKATKKFKMALLLTLV